MLNGRNIAVAALLIGFSLSACKSTVDGGPFGAQAERNPGPCPRAFAIYDASRVVNFDGAQKFANVGYTAEIAKVKSLCRYSGERPIIANVEIEFDAGRGPAAQGRSHDYQMFVAVTRKNIGVIEKLDFPVNVKFPEGSDRVRVTEVIDKIEIPRATEGTSGENFEIIVGYAVTPEQRDFNAQGKRFRPSAGQN